MTETLNQDDELLLRRYLLGKVSAEEQRAIEQRVLTDQDYFYCLLRVEEGLIDEHARGEIRGHEAQEFESQFLRNPERHDDVELAKAMHRYLANESGQQDVSQAMVLPRWRLTLEIGLACAVIVLGLLSISLLRKVTDLREQAGQIQLQADQHAEELARQVKREQEQVADLRHEVAKLQSTGTDAAGVLALVLMPGLSRNADQAATVSLSTQTKKLMLALQFDDGSYNAYRTELQTVEGTVVWSKDSLVAHEGRAMSSEVDLTLPAGLLVRSDYLILLNGANPSGIGNRVATYYLKVVRKTRISRP